jgi:hypothetical protein
MTETSRVKMLNDLLTLIEQVTHYLSLHQSNYECSDMEVWSSVRTTFGSYSLQMTVALGFRN